jgi:hypothetical protein
LSCTLQLVVVYIVFAHVRVVQLILIESYGVLQLYVVQLLRRVIKYYCLVGYLILMPIIWLVLFLERYMVNSPQRCYVGYCGNKLLVLTKGNGTQIGTQVVVVYSSAILLRGSVVSWYL